MRTQASHSNLITKCCSMLSQQKTTIDYMLSPSFWRILTLVRSLITSMKAERGTHKKKFRLANIQQKKLIRVYVSMQSKFFAMITLKTRAAFTWMTLCDLSYEQKALFSTCLNLNKKLFKLFKL